MTDRQKTPVSEGEVGDALLRAARSYVPPPESRERTLAALGLGAGAPLASLAAAKGKAAGGWALGWKIGGLLSIAAVVAGVVAAVEGGLVSSTTDSVDQRSKPIAATTVEPQAIAAPSASVDAPSVVDVPNPTAPVVTKPSSAPPHATRPATPGPSSLAEEVKMLDHVSASLAARNASGALAGLDAYQAKFPRGSMRLEASVLRIEALRQSGNVTAANARAEDFLAKHPKSPLAQRVRAGMKSGGQ